MDRPAISDPARHAYDEIVAELTAEESVKAGQMMGMPMLYLAGKGFAGLFGDAMVFKLDGEAHAAALARPGATRFDPSGRGRPMKAWVVVPIAEAAAWPALAVRAMEALEAHS